MTKKKSVTQEVASDKTRHGKRRYEELAEGVDPLQADTIQFFSFYTSSLTILSNHPGSSKKILYHSNSLIEKKRHK